MKPRCASLLLLLAWPATLRAEDPFAGVQASTLPPAPEAALPWWRENLLLRKELYGTVTAGAEEFRETHAVYTRVSAGFEVQKRFATATRTVAAADYQGRLVYRNHVLDTAADPMGLDAQGWTYETHNAVVDGYNLLGGPGRFNLRVGRFYIPFGLNTATDTHGTLLQLSNDRVFGADRDWQVTAYGNAAADLDYQAGYLLGAGPDQTYDGQAGLAAGRLGLGSAALFERGLEAGVSGACGQRVDPHAARPGAVNTWRAGADVRQRFDSRLGPLTVTGEGACGQDESAAVWSGLAQADWLHPGRRWGAAAQYFYADRGHRAADDDGLDMPGPVDERAILVLTRYFRNAVDNAALHWIALGVERQLRTPADVDDTLATVQYYRYW